MDKNRVADVLEEIGLLLEVAGENPFKARAYENAARTIRELDRDLVQMVQEGRLKELKGIGEALAEKITALVTTGALPYYDELRASVPPVLYELIRIPGLGSKKARLLADQLGVRSLDDLERACRQDRLRDLTGFGGRTQERILKGIEQVRSYGEQVLLGQALPLADALEAALRSMREVRRADCAGSARRRRETVEGLVLVASVADAARVADAFCRLPAVESVRFRSDTRLSTVCDGPVPVDLLLVRDDADYATAFLHQTGGPGHLEALEERARRRGLALREEGLFCGDQRLPCPDEEAIYRELGLPFVPPELREGGGEAGAAGSGVPRDLLQPGDVRGIFHVHSTWSDGRLPIDELVRKCVALGYQYVGISDHSQSARYARGLTPESLRQQQLQIDEARARHPGIRILKGSEVDILADGSLDYPDDVLDSLDFVVASVHSSFSLPKEEQTRRIVRALGNRHTTILGHPTGRLLLRREPYAVDLREVLEAAARAGVCVELNANPHRLDLDTAACRLARSLGVRLAIGPDAHDEGGLEDVRYGVGIARRAGLRATDILNTLPADRLDRALARPR
jgi:DNA polymerase (family 10)